jgi:hypothetical protein
MIRAVPRPFASEEKLHQYYSTTFTKLDSILSSAVVSLSKLRYEKAKYDDVVSPCAE